MSLTTRLTTYFGIEHPILLAPMAMVSGGRLAAAVTGAGGLGLIGGGYGDAEWLRTEIGQAHGARVGYGFITWSLARDPGLLDMVIAEQPATIMLSFGELRPFAERIRAAGVPLIAQVQTLDQARQALVWASLPEAIETFEKAVAAEDFDAAAILIGEGVGLIHDIRPAADIVHDMVRGATEILPQ